MSNTPRLTLPEIAENQASKYLTHNEALRRLDSLVQAGVINRTTTSPPGSPSTGDTYIVASPATGAWAGLENYYVVWDGSSWDTFEPFTSMIVLDAGAQEIIVWDTSVSPAYWSVFATITGGIDFISLGDTFASYAGKAGQILRVNQAQTGIESAFPVQVSELIPSGSPLEITPAVATGQSEAFYYVTSATSSLVLNNPTGTPLNWISKIGIRIKTEDPVTWYFDTKYRESDSLQFPTTTTGGDKTDYLLFVYNAQSDTWDFIAYNAGY